MYSSTSGQRATVYDILTYSDAFSTLNGQAKGAMSQSNTAYQQAFWIACCIHVCNNYEKWNAIVPRPVGVTAQCYNKGNLTSSSSPNSQWENVVFPGWTATYDGLGSYTSFVYYSYINYFNVIYMYKPAYEYLYIRNVYY